MGTRFIFQERVGGECLQQTGSTEEEVAAHLRGAATGDNRVSVPVKPVEAPPLPTLDAETKARVGFCEGQTTIRLLPVSSGVCQHAKRLDRQQTSPVSSKRPCWSKKGDELASGSASDTVQQPAPVPSRAVDILSIQSTSQPQSLPSISRLTNSSVGAGSSDMETPPSAAEAGSPLQNPLAASISGGEPPAHSNLCDTSSNGGSFTPSTCEAGGPADDADSGDASNGIVAGVALPAEAMAMNAAMHTYHTTLASLTAMVAAQQAASVQTTPVACLTSSTQTADDKSGNSTSPGEDISLGQVWHHAEDDIPVRLHVAKALIRLLEAGGFQQTLLGERFLHVVRRLELLLYGSASSQAEYANSNTMASRLLVLIQSHKQQQAHQGGPGPL